MEPETQPQRPPRYHALKTRQTALIAKATALQDSPTATDEEMVAVAGELEGVNANLAAWDRLHKAEKAAAPAKTNANVSVHDNREDDPRHGFANVAEFALATVASYTPGGDVDERLLIGAAAPTNYHKESGSAEGRMVPPAFKEQILEAVDEVDESLLSVVDSEPTESNSVEVLRDETTPWGASGVQAYWRAEAGEMSPSKLETEGEQMKVHELYAFVLATEELLKDAPRLNARLTKKSGQAIAYKTNEAIVNGTGTGQPLGWSNSPAKVTVAAEGGQGADTVLAANIAKMFARLQGIKNGVWYTNQDVLPQLLTMTLGQNSIYVPPSSGFQNAPGGFLLGRPVVPLENCATVGDVGDIQFVNPKGYYAALRGATPEFAESMHLYFNFALRAFRWTFRMGGQPHLSKAITPAKGAATRSHFVVLAAR